MALPKKLVVHLSIFFRLINKGQKYYTPNSQKKKNRCIPSALSQFYLAKYTNIMDFPYL